MFEHIFQKIGLMIDLFLFGLLFAGVVLIYGAAWLLIPKVRK